MENIEKELETLTTTYIQARVFLLKEQLTHFLLLLETKQTDIDSLRFKLGAIEMDLQDLKRIVNKVNESVNLT